jgi:uncharacterized protein
VIDAIPLSAFAFAAGFIDAVAGGGGLIQLPALMIFLPHASIADISGTNKCASICGTSVAMVRYARSVPIHWRSVIPAAIAAFASSFLGARCISLLDQDIARQVVLALLIAVGAYTFFRRDLGAVHAPRWTGNGQQVFAVLVGGGLGFYDGFFGPGMGSFLIALFVGVAGYDFLSASAVAKIINFSTNLAAVAYFAGTGHVLWELALPMAACSILGSVIGSHLAIAKGSRFVRRLFLVVVTGLILKISYDLIMVPTIQPAAATTQRAERAAP